MARTGTSLRGCAANALLLGCSLVITCGAAEIGLRYLRPQPLEAAYVWPDGTLRHRPSFRFTYTRTGFSNEVGYNALGLRGPEVAASATPGTPRVLFLGDSFVEGKQVADDEVLTSVMQRMRRTGGAPLEVVNAGVAGYGTSEELILWDRLGASLHPDLVLLGFYPNDVVNNVERGLFGLKDGRAVLLREPRRPKVRWTYDARRFLSSHSHLYMLVKLGLDALKEGDDAMASYREAEEVFARSPTERIERGWSLTFALLEELRAHVLARGARFAVVVFPTRFQVDDALWRDHARAIGIDAGQFDLTTPQRLLAAWAGRSGTPLLDLLGPFRAGNRSNSFYNAIDAHWNSEGHRLAAESIVGWLTDKGLIGSAPR